MRYPTWVRRYRGRVLGYDIDEPFRVDMWELRQNLRLPVEERLRAGERRDKAAQDLRRYRNRVRQKIRAAAPHLLAVYDALGTLKV